MSLNAEIVDYLNDRIRRIEEAANAPRPASEKMPSLDEQDSAALAELRRRRELTLLRAMLRKYDVPF